MEGSTEGGEDLIFLISYHFQIVTKYQTLFSKISQEIFFVSDDSEISINCLEHILELVTLLTTSKFIQMIINPVIDQIGKAI